MFERWFASRYRIKSPKKSWIELDMFHIYSCQHNIHTHRQALLEILWEIPLCSRPLSKHFYSTHAISCMHVSIGFFYVLPMFVFHVCLLVQYNMLVFLALYAANELLKCYSFHCNDLFWAFWLLWKWMKQFKLDH